MPPITRKFVFDKQAGKVVELVESQMQMSCIKALPQWPLHSEAMAVNPEDIPKAREIAKQHGLSTDYDRNGCPILTSQRHRKLHAEAFGFYDRNAGLGDPAPRNR